MPGGDRTGPLGEGPMTGRGLGSCGGFSAPGYAQGTGGWGRGFGRGRGFAAGGRGRRNVFWATGVPGWARGSGPPAVPMNERQWLEARAEALEREMAGIRAQLEDLAGRDRREPEGAGE